MALASAVARSNFISLGHELNSDDASAITQLSKGFGRLPPEVNQQIATYLSDKDLAAFALVEKVTCDAVVPIFAGHWRVRFREQYDDCYTKPSVTLVADYKLRRRFFKPRIYFKLGHSAEERSCLAVIRQLMIESAWQLPDALSNNFQQLWRFMKKSNLLFDAFRWVRPDDVTDGDLASHASPLLMTIRVFFFTWHLFFTGAENLTAAYPLSLRQNVYHIKWSQDIVLARGYLPLIDMHGNVDMGLLCHLTNFWRFHLTLSEGPLWRIWSKVRLSGPPIAARRPLMHNRVLFHENWKGAMFHPLGETTRSFGRDGISQDDVYTIGFFTGGDKALDLNVKCASNNVPWPDKFEKAVHGLPYFQNDPKVFDRQSPIRDFNNPEYRKDRSSTIKASQPGPAAYQASLPSRRAVKPVANAQSKHKYGKYNNCVKYASFFGTIDANCGDRDLNLAGVVHPLPLQSGVCEWQRITMVSYITPPTGTASKGYLDAKEDHLHVYTRFEGIICPGTQMILGRYHIGDDYDDGTEDQAMNCGPFVFWNTDEMNGGANEYVHDDSAEHSDDSNGNGHQVSNNGLEDAAAPASLNCSPDTNTSSSENTSSTEPMTLEEEEDEDERYWLAALKALHED
ncbi:MAG: hypothetical protein Q9170_001708 [Blastenia crenularia]